ncbi:Cys-Gln thioester bond-forming surface protein [Micromonospora sp. RHAY321]|uniref:Cys-Gln thioester bond-forming surface protein n=1 Tax=Micromonospora sp. RHAY321 TaxID=2944807 RepID=UPI00207C422B|nr:Cys-Gln thioester bond-forming surface protein [Micromonospora sp. RHAY321]MCO1599507.1 Cys-Gln thioester bond-forming surface protein [Micromonospora sp. RHAY321]
MLGQRGRRWARVALAAVAGGALALGVAKAVDGTDVTLKLNGKQRTTSALALRIDGKLVPAFCIDYHTSVKLDGKYEEGTWDESQVKNLGKVQWVLTHGYPNANSTALLAAAGVTTKVGQKRLDTLLYFGTQTAVWHFSDGVKLGAWEKGLLARDQYDVIQKVRDYLVKNATDQPEPRAELSVDPANATATVGGKAGPFTVKGPAGAITIAATGGTAVDAEGKPVTTTTNGGQFWLSADGAGTVNVTLTAQDSVSFGRVFLFTGKTAAQKLILGGSTGATVTARAQAGFTAPTPSASPSTPAATPSATPSPATPSATPTDSSPASPAPSTSPASNGGGLPLTGSPIATAATVGVLLLAAGAVTVLMVRRRKVRFTA